MSAHDDEHCPKRADETHCVHWWDGEACCSCGAPAMTAAERAELDALNGEEPPQP